MRPSTRTPLAIEGNQRWGHQHGRTSHACSTAVREARGKELHMSGSVYVTFRQRTQGRDLSRWKTPMFGGGERSLQGPHTGSCRPRAFWVLLQWWVHDTAKPTHLCVPAPAYCLQTQRSPSLVPAGREGKGRGRRAAPEPRETAPDRTRPGEGQGRAAHKHRTRLRNVPVRVLPLTRSTDTQMSAGRRQPGLRPPEEEVNQQVGGVWTSPAVRTPAERPLS